MAGALVGAASCARCGFAIDGTPRFCVRCGVLLVPAASGSILGSYSGMLAGVARASAARRNGALLIDLAPVVILVVLAISLASGSVLTPGTAVVGAIVLGGAYVAVELSTLSRAGSSPGRAILRLRTVDDLTGEPVSVGRLVRELLTGRLGRRTVTSDLRLGRDPRGLAQPALGPDALLVDESQVPTSGRSARVSTPAEELGPADTVAIVLDTGERLQFGGSVLVGRVPENRNGGEKASDSSSDDAVQLFAWPDLSRSLSKTHALLEWAGTVLWVTDLHSANGSVLVSPEGERRPLVPGIRGASAVGWTVELGDRSFAVRPASSGGGE